jgi:hypothetical protein
VHFQQIAIAFPALLYAIVRYPRVRTWAAGGLIFAMLPWNVLGSTLLSGCAPLLAGTLGALVLGRRAGLVAAGCAAAVVLSLLLFALVGLGPPPVHFVPRAYPPNALAELSWGDFSHLSLMRPSLMMQWLRVPTMLGLAFALAALVRIAFDGASLGRRATIPSPEIAPAGAR